MCGEGRERLPVVRQKFMQPGHTMLRDARENIAEPGERLDAAPFAGSDKAAQHGRDLTATITPEEGPVAAPMKLNP